MNKLSNWLSGAALVVALGVAALVLVGGNQSGQLSASGSRFPNGISADGTSPSTGQVRGTTLTMTGAASAASLTVVNGVSTSTAAIGSSAIGVNVGKSCLWNGASYSITSFPSNSTTPTYATSTSCQ